MSNTERTDFFKHRVAEVTGTLELLIMAFVLAFVFRAFVMEAFRIPTGSMANTLNGAHFPLRCVQCGFRYNYGFVPELYNMPEDSVPQGFVKPVDTRCPNCGFIQQAGDKTPVSYGDRLLVLKSIYQFGEPRRWDVIVFKNPLDPSINYIKRLLALPGETVEIIDGDIFINGKIARKPPKVQKELWMPVYNNDHQPARPESGSFNGHTWQQPFRNVDNSQWKLGTRFSIESEPNEIHTIEYDTSVGNDFRAAYAYNNINDIAFMPWVNDIKAEFLTEWKSEKGGVGAEIITNRISYRACVNWEGKLSILGESDEILAEEDVILKNQIQPVRFSFSIADKLLTLEFGSEKLSYDIGSEQETFANSNMRPAKLHISGSGNIILSHIAVYRDIYYTEAELTGRASEGKAFELGESEFFVLGDNSPNSMDSRWWDQYGIGNNEMQYEKGIVPREFIVGKAMFVYWSAGFKLFKDSRVGVIPNFGQMRFVHGGKE